MNGIDLLLILAVLLGMVMGWRTGFIAGAFELARWICSLLLGLWLYKYVARLLSALIGGESSWVPAVALVATLLAVGALLRWLGAYLLRNVPAGLHRSPANRALGLLPGGLTGLIGAAVIAALLLAIPLPEPVRTAAQESPIANSLASHTDRLEDLLAPALDPSIARTLNRITTIRPDASESVVLPFTVHDALPRPDLEGEMLKLVNRERIDAGLHPLVADTALRGVARSHSTDMFVRGYFAHATPEGRTPFDRIDDARIRYRLAGENLALAPTVELAHTGLMESPGHRANILRREFGRVGIGIMDGGARGVMVTQNFRN